MVESFADGGELTTRGVPDRVECLDGRRGTPDDVSVYGLELPEPSTATEAPRLAGHAKDSWRTS